MTETSDTFACFGSQCSIYVSGDARDAVAAARRRLLDWHERFTRFKPTSELSLLNASPEREVAVSEDMARFAQAVVDAAERTHGLVDGTLLAQLEAAGYDADLRAPLPLELALRLAPRRRPARPSPQARRRELRVDTAHNVVRRPPGLGLDSGGLAKGMLADLLAADLAAHDSFAIDCAGDVRTGGTAALERPVNVAGPFDGRIIETLRLVGEGVATSGIGRRSWLDARGRPCHHLLDPATGRPAFTGVVQATAIAATALEAEIRAKAAVLSGPEAAPRWLPDGGVLVFDDGSHVLLTTQNRETTTPRGDGGRAR